jgi:membrane protein implicated in regulation of membrane protease activity
MRLELVVWAGLALLLIAAEALLPGVFLLWLGFAAAAMFLLLLVVDLL